MTFDLRIAPIVASNVKSVRSARSLFLRVVLKTLPFAVRVGARDANGGVEPRAICADGKRDILGIWVEQSEGAKFWLKVMNELKNRGLHDILIAVVDGLKGFPEAIHAAFPQTTVQTCIVHLVRHSLNFCSFKDRKAVAADLKSVYRAETVDAAVTRLEEFDAKWGGQYPSIVKSWRTNWQNIIPFFAFPQDIRRIIYTTNAIESLNSSIRKIIKTRGSFPNDDSAIKLIYLAIQNAGQLSTAGVWGWKTALNQFAILFENRMPNQT